MNNVYRHATVRKYCSDKRVPAGGLDSYSSRDVTDVAHEGFLGHPEEGCEDLLRQPDLTNKARPANGILEKVHDKCFYFCARGPDDTHTWFGHAHGTSIPLPVDFPRVLFVSGRLLSM